jgi:hypothetical protein
VLGERREQAAFAGFVDSQRGEENLGAGAARGGYGFAVISEIVKLGVEASGAGVEGGAELGEGTAEDVEVR